MRTFTVHQVEQRSEQWRQLRAARLRLVARMRWDAQEQGVRRVQ